MDKNLAADVNKLIASSSSILIFIKNNPTLDAVSGALSLYQSLAFQEKSVVIYTPAPLSVEYSSLFSVDKITNKIGNKNLIISLDYVDGSIDKVSYDVKGDKFNLVIQPKVGFPPFTQDKIHYSYSGVNADLLIAVGIQNKEELITLFDQEKEALFSLPIINIDNHSLNANYGNLNLVDAASSTISEIVLDFLNQSSVKIEEDTASNILTAIESATDFFKSEKVTAQTFENAALCLKNGAKRIYQYAVKPAPPEASQTPLFQNPEINLSSQPTAISSPLPFSSPQPSVEATPNPPTPSEPSPSSKPPPDWLQPKIYKGGQLL